MDDFEKEIFQGRSPLEKWFQTFGESQVDLWEKGETVLFPYLLTITPRRWYSRLVIPVFTPCPRPTQKFFCPLALDYESLFLGGVFGLILTFRHYLDYHLAKTPEFRPGEAVCCGRNNHFYVKWYRSHINPRKYVEHDRKLFRKKLHMGLSHGLQYAIFGGLISHCFSAQSLDSAENHFATFVAATCVTINLYLHDKDYMEKDIHFGLYKYPELYAITFLMIYTSVRYFRNYTSGIPFRRVLFG